MRGTGYNRRRRVWLREGAGLPYRWWVKPVPWEGRYTVSFDVGAMPYRLFPPGNGPSPRARRVGLSTFDTLPASAWPQALLERVWPHVVAEWRLAGGLVTVWLEERVPRPEGFVASDVRRFGRAVSRQKVVCLNPSVGEGWYCVDHAWEAHHVPGWSPSGRLLVVNVEFHGVGVFRVGRATRPETAARVVAAATALRLPAYGDPGAELWLRAAQ